MQWRLGAGILNWQTAMSDIFDRTQQRIQQWLTTLRLRLTQNAKVAVFGAGPYGRYLMSLLKADGIDCPIFIDSVLAGSKQDGYPVVSLKELSDYDISDIISGSLAAPDTQQILVQSIYPSIHFHALEHGKSLCTEPRFNPCDSKALERLKHSLHGKTVCVIGNGPSLNSTPPEQLKNCVTMAGNGILLRPNFVPDFYFMLEQKALQHWGEQIQNLQMPQILPSHLFESLGNAPQRYYYPACYEASGDIIEPYHYGIAAGGTIISTMIYFAIYMGAARIVILGVDNNFVGTPAQTHFSQAYYANDRKALEPSKAMTMAEKQKAGILRAVEAAKRAGVAVFDATAADNNLGVTKLNYENLKVECGA